MKLAHFSDIHLCPEHGGPAQRQVLLSRVDDAAEQGAEHLVFAGDLVEYGNLSDAGRFFNALRKRGWRDDQISIVPGNHDVFPLSPRKVLSVGSLEGVPLLPRRRARANADWLDRQARRFGRRDTRRVRRDRAFPYIRKLGGDTLLIGFDSTMPVKAHLLSSAAGVFHQAEANALGAVLDEPEFLEAKHRVLLVHHWPFEWVFTVFPPLRVNLKNRAFFADWLERYQIDLVLAGHIHGARTAKLGRTTIVGAGSHFEKKPRRVVHYEAGYQLVTLGRRVSVKPHYEKGTLKR